GLGQRRRRRLQPGLGQQRGLGHYRRQYCLQQRPGWGELTMKSSAKVFVAIIVLAGLAVLFSAPFHSDGLSPQWGRFTAFLILTMIAAGMHVTLPGITGSMSVNLPFILLAVTQLSLFEALIVACGSAVVQYLTMRKKVEIS